MHVVTRSFILISLAIAPVGCGSSNDKSSDSCNGALVCESFEGFALGGEPAGNFKTQKNSGTVSIDSTHYFSGTKSVKLTTEAKDQTKTAFIRLDSGVFPVNGNAFFGRMMFFLESAPTADVHWTLIQGGGLVPDQSYHSLYRYGGQHPISDSSGAFLGSQLMANYETPDSYSGTGPSSDCWQHSDSVLVPVQKWACVEWQFDGPNNQMHLWLDGKAIDSLTINGRGQGCVHQGDDFPWTAPSFDQLELGWESYQTDDARTLYIDDVAVSTQRIGCPSSGSAK
jgi:hypothetical protein